MKVDFWFSILIKVVFILWSLSANAEDKDRDFYTVFIGDCHIPIPVEMTVDGTYESDFKFYDSHGVHGEIVRGRSIIVSSSFDIRQSALFSKMEKLPIASSGKFKLVRYASRKFKSDINVLISNSGTGETDLVVMFQRFDDSYSFFAYEFCINHTDRQLLIKK